MANPGNGDLPLCPPSLKIAPGISLIAKFFRKDVGLHEHKIIVLFLTFIAYACFHASRKPLSIVKSVLDPEALNNVTFFTGAPSAPSPAIELPVLGWPPFNGELGKARLGEIDVAFLASYAVGMYFAGALGDRLDLRKFLTFGMFSSGACVCLFGVGYWWDIHYFQYYFIVQVITGLLSSTGWPAVVAIVANWFGKKKKGLIMGIWNSHTSIGNMAGSIIAAAALPYGWGWSFVVPGMALMLCALVVFLFLITEPTLVGLPPPDEDGEKMTGPLDDERKLLLAESQLGDVTSKNLNGQNSQSHGGVDGPAPFTVEWCRNTSSGKVEEMEIADEHSKVGDGKDVAIHFFEAWRIPGVALYALCLFFVKLVAYTFLFWLPFYIRHTEIAGQYLSDKTAGYLSTIFDLGGVIGGIIAGHLSDKYNAKAIVSVVLMYCAVPSLYLFRIFGGVSLAHAVGLMMVSGVFVNGPYALITTAVAADLGTHSSLRGNAKASATVTAIIDGTGSVGAAVGPLLTGYIASQSWTAVFLMLATSLLIAGLFLTKLVTMEIKEKVRVYRGPSKSLQDEELRGTHYHQGPPFGLV